MNSLAFQRIDERAILPTRGSKAAAGLDLYSIEDLMLEPGERTLARTGLSVAIPEGFYGRVAPRSGLAVKHGLDVMAGVIDSDYRGELQCLIINSGASPISLPARSKICQLIIEHFITPEAVWSDQLNATARGACGFGSTDVT